MIFSSLGFLLDSFMKFSHAGLCKLGCQSDVIRLLGSVAWLFCGLPVWCDSDFRFYCWIILCYLVGISKIGMPVWYYQNIWFFNLIVFCSLVRNSKMWCQCDVIGSLGFPIDSFVKLFWISKIGLPVCQWYIVRVICLLFWSIFKLGFRCYWIGNWRHE